MQNTANFAIVSMYWHIKPANMENVGLILISARVKENLFDNNIQNKGKPEQTGSALCCIKIA